MFDSTIAMEARSHFLSSAARLYNTTSPSTSAHLMAERLELDSTLEKKQKPNPAPCCSACGTIQILGITSRKTTRSHRKSTRASKAPRPTTKILESLKSQKSGFLSGSLETEIVEECLTCRKNTVHPLPNDSKPRRLITGQSITPQGQESTGMDRTSRNRIRKKRPNDLLAKSLEEEKAKKNKELDLMDFMRAA